LLLKKDEILVINNKNEKIFSLINQGENMEGNIIVLLIMTLYSNTLSRNSYTSLVFQRITKLSKQYRHQISSFSL